MVEIENVNGGNGPDPGNGLLTDTELSQNYRLIYFSASLLPSFELGGERMLQDLQAVCVSRNQKMGVTGVLAFNDWRFSGVLEGSKTDVVEIFRSIQKDTRHADIVVVEEGWLARRGFTGWGTAFVGGPMSPQSISANLQLQHIIERENWTSIAVVEMLKFFLVNDPPNN